MVAARWWVLAIIGLLTIAATQFLPSLASVGGGLSGLLGELAGLEGELLTGTLDGSRHAGRLGGDACHVNGKLL